MVRKLRASYLNRLPGNLLITSNHPVRIEGKWQKPGQVAFSERVELEEPVFIYNCVLDKCHILLVNGYECVTLGHNLADQELYHPYYGTDKCI